MKLLAVATIVGAGLIVPAGSVAWAGSGNPSTTGQPSADCSTTGPNFPGNSGSSPGSAFNGSAGNVYANPGSQGGTSSGGNQHVVAQYDVACVQNNSH